MVQALTRLQDELSDEDTRLQKVLKATHQSLRCIAAEEGLARFTGDGVEVVAEGAIAAYAAVLVFFILASLDTPVPVRWRVFHRPEVV